MKERIKEKAVALENILSGMDRTRSAGVNTWNHSGDRLVQRKNWKLSRLCWQTNGTSGWINASLMMTTVPVSWTGF